MDYVNENIERVISILEGVNMELDDGSQWHFSIQPPPSNWEPSDDVRVEKSGRMMYKIVNLDKGSEGIATMGRNAADANERALAKNCSPIFDQPLQFVAFEPNGVIKLSAGPDYQLGGINAAKVNLKRWNKGEPVKVVEHKGKFSLLEMINTDRNESIDVVKVE